jgi:plastocyanin
MRCHSRNATLLLFYVACSVVTRGAEYTVKDATGALVADAVLWLERLDGPATAPTAPPEPVAIVQADEEFRPAVTVVAVGTRVEFPNRDKVQHHIYSLSKAKRFEFPLYRPGTTETIVCDQPGVIVLGCNIHDWMAAYVVVVPTPYFARTDATGRAQLAAPAGRYRLEVWHARLAAALVREVTVDAGGAVTDLTIALKPERKVRRAPAGRAGGY